MVNGRIGMVLSGKGGTLLTMLPSFKLGIAGIVGNGLQYVSWVDIRDIVSMIHFIIEEPSIAGPVNLVSPEPATNFIFTKTLGRILEKPTGDENARFRRPPCVRTNGRGTCSFQYQGCPLVIDQTKLSVHRTGTRGIAQALFKRKRVNDQT